MHDASVGVRLALAISEWIEPPDHPPAVGAQGNDREGRCGRVKNSIDDHRRRLDLRVPRGRVTRVVSPREAERSNVATVYLIERGVPAVPGVTTGGLPIGGRNGGWGCLCCASNRCD